MDLEGKVALVTGGAHRVGKGIAEALARAGAHVVVHYGHAAEDARATTTDIKSRGVRALAVQADLRDPAQIAALFEAVRAEFGRLDVLVNSAANFKKRAFEEIPLAEWDEVLRVNLTAPFLCTQHAARLMRAVERAADETAAIVNIGDRAGMVPWRSFAAHGVSKAGLIQLTKAAALELAPLIRVNAVVPGPILPPPNMALDSEAWRALGQRVPLQRTGNPAQIGAAVVFLARSEYITGAALPVDGGEHLVSAHK